MTCWWARGWGEVGSCETGIAGVSAAPETGAFHSPAAPQEAWDDGASTQALPGTVGRGCPVLPAGRRCLVLPVPSPAVGTRPALPLCWFPSQGDEWDAHPQLRFGWRCRGHPSLRLSMLQRKEPSPTPAWGAAPSRPSLLPGPTSTSPGSAAAEASQCARPGPSIPSALRPTRTRDRGMAWDCICVTTCVAMEMGRSCANGNQTWAGGPSSQ